VDGAANDRGVTFECPECGRQFDAERTACPGHGRGLVPTYDESTVREQFDPETPTGLWRYRPFLPVDATDPVTLGEGGTPLVAAEALGDRLDVSLSLKRDGANPTGSSKDRGSSVLVTHAREQGRTVVTCASTGNAAASVAAYAARAGMSCPLFVPSGTAKTKITQPLATGADVFAVDGGYDDAYEVCRRVAGHGFLDRSPGATPHVLAGARTLGFELAEQTPGVDWLVVAMGNGGTAAAAWQGWRAFADLGFVDRTPRLLGVQADGASAIHDAFSGPASQPHADPDTDSDPDDGRTSADTCVDSIAVGRPHRLDAACRALRESGGATVTVSDEAIREATARLGRAEGLFVEAACGSTIAGIRLAREQGIVDRGDSVVAVLTGHGLKTTTTAGDSHSPSPEVLPADANTEALARRYSSGGRESQHSL
jgi:threonine synthase